MFAKRDSRGHTFAHRLQGQFALTYCAGAMMNPARPQAGLGKRKFRAFGAQQVLDGHSNIAEKEFTVPFRSMMVHDRNIPHYRQSFRVHGNQRHRIAGVTIGLLARHAHHDDQGAVRMPTAADP